MTLTAVVFDAYGTLFDVYSVGAAAEQMYPGHGTAISTLWRDKQIEYTRLISLSDPDSVDGSEHYLPFWELTRRALRYTLERLGLPGGEAAVEDLLAQYAQLTAFPENQAVLARLRAHGLSTAILSNGNPEMLDASVRSAGMEGLLDHVISVDSVRQFKTMPVSYALVAKTMAVEPSQVLFVSSNAWDVLGAGWFGFTTLWINRQGLPCETIGPRPHHMGPDLRAVLAVLGLEN